MMSNEIKTLKDLKMALKDIPDKVLDEFGAGVDSEGGNYVALLCWGNEGEEYLALCDYYSKQTEKYPALDKISKWIENIAKEQEKLEKESDEPYEREEPISSDELKETQKQKEDPLKKGSIPKIKAEVLKEMCKIRFKNNIALTDETVIDITIQKTVEELKKQIKEEKVLEKPSAKTESVE